uniref:Peptidyl-prolyl cis-trans isomerase n=1 Tax=Aplanochytrium stocchinoi TaxID=215587 RepID=A0A7S3P9V6_9STRA|mmetsp:Transcript_14731/g.18220  ORF Transcript_14731/g.18220 Transcript_14731/m.18220 type:complete len:135 (+) Transcript_14731:128-532(+)
MLLFCTECSCLDEERGEMSSPLVPTEVQVSHLLLKHTESRNPVSRRTGQPINLTKEDAIRELETLRLTLNRENFAEIASQRSDCGSFQAGGDLGVFGKGVMQKPFEDAAFSLQPFEMSNIISTDSGVHVILRTG